MQFRSVFTTATHQSAAAEAKNASPNNFSQHQRVCFRHAKKEGPTEVRNSRLHGHLQKEPASSPEAPDGTKPEPWRPWRRHQKAQQHFNLKDKLIT